MTDPLPVRGGYDQWSATYDTDVNRTRDLDAAVLRETPLPLEGAQVVEIGAGTGKNTVFLASRAREVLALDLSEGMLAKARARVTAGHVRFVQHDITTPWPCPQGWADLVIGNLVLEHVVDLPAVFAAARHALRPGGAMMLSELHPFRQWRGSGATIASPEGERRIAVVLHSIAGYVNAALAADFTLTAMAEIGDPGDIVPPAVPRLLQLTFATT